MYSWARWLVRLADDVGEYAIHLGTLAIKTAFTGKYTLPNAATLGNYTITKLPVTYSSSSADRVYDGTDAAPSDLGGTFNPSLISGDTVTVSGGNYSQSDVKAGLTISGALAGGSDLGNYDVTVGTITGDITKKEVTVAAATLTKEYDGGTSRGSATFSGGAITGAVSGQSLTLSVTGGTYDNKNVGTGKTISGATIGLTAGTSTDADNYMLPSTIDLTGVITARAVTYSATSVNKVYDGTNTAPATLGGSFSPALFTGDVVTISGGTYSQVDVGTNLTISAFTLGGADKDNYAVTFSVTGAITKLATTYSSTAANKVYDGTNAAPTNLGGTFNPVLITGDTVTVTGGTYSQSNVGANLTITGASAIGTDLGNYEVTVGTITGAITRKPVTYSATSVDKVYDGTNTAPSSLGGSFNPALLGSDVVTVSGGTYSQSDVGTSLSITGATIGGAAKDNYAVTLSVTGSITKRAITAVGGVTVNTRSVDGTTTATFDTSSATGTGVLSGELPDFRSGGLEVSGTYPDAAKTTAGTYSIAVTYSLADAGSFKEGNYSMSVTGTLSGRVNAQPTLTITPTTITRVYGETEPTTFNYTVSGPFESGDSASTSFFTSNPLSRASGNDAGTYAFMLASTPSYASGIDAKYDFTLAPGVVYTITKKPVTYSATSVNKVYDGTNTAPTSLGGSFNPALITGDTVTVSGGTYNNKNVGTSKAISDSTIGGADKDNYAVTLSVTGSITKLATAYSSTAANKVYDGTNAAPSNLGGSFDPALLGSDVVTVSGGTYSQSDAKDDLTITGASASGTNLGNYDVTVGTITGDITAKVVTVAAATLTKAYNGNTSTSGATLGGGAVSGEVGSQSLTLSITGATYDNKNVGTGKTITGATFGLTAGTSTDADNYDLPTSITITGVITAKVVTVAAATLTKEYDGNTSITGATLSGGAVTGEIGSESVTLSVTGGTYDNKNVGTGKTINNPTYSLTAGASTTATNYSVPNSITLRGVITAKAITDVTGVAVTTRVVDGTTDATFNTAGANGAGVLSSELSDFRGGGLVVNGAFPDGAKTTAGSYTIAATYSLANRGSFLAANYNLSDSGDNLSGTISAFTKTFSIANASAAEGASASLSITLGENAPTGGLNFTVAYGYASPSTAVSTDLSGTPPATVSVGVGTTSATLTIPLALDATEESDETFQVTISTATSGWREASTGSGSATVTITDATETLSLSSATASTTEGTAASLTVTRSGSTAGRSVSFTVRPSVITGGSNRASANDFTTSAVNGQLAAGSASTTISLPTTDDNVDEADETFRATLAVAASTGYRLGSVSTATVTIIDNDLSSDTVATDLTLTFTPAYTPSPPYTYSPDRPRYEITVPNEVTDVRVTPTIRDPGGTVSVNSNPVPSGTTSPNIPLTPGETTTVTVVITAEDRTTTRTYTVAITRLALPTSLTLSAPPSVAEGTTAEVTARLNQPAPTGGLTVTFTPNGSSTATGNSDYRLLNSTIFIRANASTGTARVEVLADEEDDADETIVLDAAVTTTTPALSARATMRITEGTSALNRAASSLAAEVARAVTGGAVDVVNARIERLKSGGQPSAATGLTMNFATMLSANADDVDSMRAEDWLSGLSFAHALGASADGGDGGSGVTLWGSGRRRSLSGEFDSIDWEGNASDIYLGADRRLGEGRAAGVVLSRTKGEFDWKEGRETAHGTYGFDIRSVHPYFIWRADERWHLWGAAGYGGGKVEPQERGGAGTENDTSLLSVTLGGQGKLREYATDAHGSSTSFSLKTEMWAARINVDGDEVVEEHDAEVHRLRLMLAASHTHVLAAGGAFTPSLELGLRREGGDGTSGMGVEFGGAMRFTDSTSRWTAEGRARTLWSRNAYREWGVGGSLQLAAGAGKRGLSLRFAPSWGETAASAENMWGDETVAHASAPTASVSPEGRFDASIGYGMPAFGGAWSGVPHVGVSVNEASRTWRLGWRLITLPSHEAFNFELDLEGTLIEHTDGNGSIPDTYGVRLRGVVRW